MLIIADEPTGAIDVNTKDSIMEFLAQLNREGKTIIIVTHDSEVSQHARKRYVMEDKKLKEL